MNRQVTIASAVVGLMLLTPTLALADVFGWEDRVRPPVSLQEALTIGEKLLGDDAKNRYCVEVSIYGNPFGAAKPGAWNLYFAAPDGSKKQVYVDMDRNSKVTTWNEAIDWTKDAGRRNDLKDAYVRLQALFKKEHLDVHLELKDGHLLGSYRTRKYQVYTTKDDGSYSDQLTEQVGPAADGFAFDAEIVDEGQKYFRFDSAPYWEEHTLEYPTSVKGKLLVARKQIGRRVLRYMEDQIDQAFGIDFRNASGQKQ